MIIININTNVPPIKRNERQKSDSRMYIVSQRTVSSLLLMDDIIEKVYLSETVMITTVGALSVKPVSA